MKVLIINETCGIGSTGKICVDIANKYANRGDEVVIAHGRYKRVSADGKKYSLRIGSDFDVKIHGVLTRIFDIHGLGSVRATKKFLKWIDEYNPDLVWLHNIHGYYINYALLFNWLKKHPDIKKKWTLHDCWAFTGHCSHFILSNCDKWKTGCYNCPSKKEYPKSIVIDNSKNNYLLKKELFSNIENLELITPSEWLANLTRYSFLNKYPVSIVYNTIDKTVFKPTPSDLREKLRIYEKKVILGVASPWSDKKGLNDFITLAKALNEEYVIILIGMKTEQIKALSQDKDIKKLCNELDGNAVSIIYESCGDNQLINIRDNKHSYIINNGNYLIEPGVENIVEVLNTCSVDKNISSNTVFGNGTRCILIPRTDSQDELAQYYTMADYFVNPTYEDNYPTVNLEAIACGAKVITYDVGGCKETLGKNK